MNVKLTQGISGDGCGGAGYFVPRQIIKCSDEQGARWIKEGIATEAPEGAEIEGEHFDHVPEPAAPARRRQPERADAPAAETPESGGPTATCQGTTTLGNRCRKSTLPGSKFCAKHQE